MLSLTQKFYKVLCSQEPEPVSPYIPSNDTGPSPPEKNCRGSLRSRQVPKIQKDPIPNYVNRLSLENIRRIFQFYVDEPSSDSALFSNLKPRPSSLTSTLSSSASPFILASVCILWRHLALSEPRLWSSLAVYRPKTSQINTIRLWLERSQKNPLSIYPLSVYLYEPATDPLSDHLAREEILFLFHAHAHRIKHFYAKVSGGHPAESLYTLPTHKLARLESVELDLTDYEGDYDSAWHGFHDVPSLRRIAWDPSSVIHGVHDFAPWSTLTHVKLPYVADLTIDELLSNLIYAVNLVDLDLEMTMPVRVPPPSHKRIGIAYSGPAALEFLRRPPRVGCRDEKVSDGSALGRAMQVQANLELAMVATIDLPSLRSLRIHAHRRDAAPLLDRLKLPELKSLHIIHSITDPIVPSTRYITALLERSGGLETLSIYDPNMSEDEIVHLTESPRLRVLRNLDLQVGPVGDNTIGPLIVRHGARHRLPKLTNLTLADCVTSEGLCYAMAASRRPVLKTFKFCVAEGTPLNDIVDLRKLASRGGFSVYPY
ncbi:hypothetical protein DXG03_003000 [Asterophora parasitica]|uniref:F-box domain-containing protein n=1 Tax=Asterophora parasitica TaxID=117018 RepID=A0A9P7G7T6_9AGAR|nr:hypothetical protein DXG03_003000 [Asterophora parasitica]